VRVAIGIAILVLAGSGSAVAAERPAGAVGSAIVRGIPAAERTDMKKVPGGCLAMDIRVSANGRWASVTPVITATLRCERYGRDGSYLLRKATAGWRLAFVGSDPPACSLGVPRDLVRQCLRG
jgi:hypothetical protein